MDKLTKARILAVVMLKGALSILALVFASKYLYVLITKYAGVPFPPTVYWALGALLSGGFGAIAGWMFSSYKKRTIAPQEKDDRSTVA